MRTHHFRRSYLKANKVSKTDGTRKVECTYRFYHAMGMPSADYAVARCSCVCPSVHLSHAGIVSKRLHKSSKFFTNPTILVFPYQTGWQYSDGNPLNGGVECKRGMKNHDFRPISRSTATRFSLVSPASCNTGWSPY